MNDEDKNASIAFILAHGLIKPQPVRARIAEMLRHMGLRYIFWDTGYSLFFAAVTIAVVLVLFAFSPMEYRYSASVAVAPLMFLVLTAFSETTERACGLYELKQTCRYTIRQISAFRVACYSIIGLLYTAVVAGVGALNWYEFLSLFPLCLSVLFIYAALSLLVMRFLRQRWVHAAYSALWLIVSAAPFFSYDKRWEAVLSSTPIVLSVIVAVAGAVVVAHQISKMLSEVRYVAAQ